MKKICYLTEKVVKILRLMFDGFHAGKSWAENNQTRVNKPQIKNVIN